jgi:HlyD family secretion protein
MKAKTVWIVGILLAGAGLALGWWKPWRPADAGLAELTWGEVTRGDLEVVVSSTGTLEALDSVEVGTQVSGTLTEMRVDFNDRVKKGQVLAVIDTTLLDASLRDAQAGYARAKAEFDQAEADGQARRQLFTEGLLSQSELRTYETAITAARSGLESASAQVERARQNRANAVITSPIDGLVVERAVEVGQTVAASFSTPRLFLLARDLSEMRILAEVDEGDIGQIRLDQAVNFQVAAQPERRFEGKVRQLRLQPKVDQNVVKYTVVVDAPNAEGLLLPGMTATLDFVVETAHDVLTVPVAATRVRPNAAMLEQLKATGGREGAGRTAERGASGNAGRGGRSGAGGAPTGPSGASTGPSGAPAEGGASDVRRLFLKDEQGRLVSRPVRLGLTDGRRVEIKPMSFGPESGSAPEILPGTAVVIGAPGASGTGPNSARPGTTPGPRGFRVL